MKNSQTMSMIENINAMKKATISDDENQHPMAKPPSLLQLEQKLMSKIKINNEYKIPEHNRN